MTAKKIKSVSLPKKAKKVLTPAQLQAQAVAEALKAEAEAMRALVEKYSKVENPKPHLECEIFPLPDYCSVPDVCMRELDGLDDISASYWADMNASAEVKDSQSAASLADRREGLRLALVGVDGRQVNEDGVPFMDCDHWTSRTWYMVMQIFIQMNGVAESDVKNVLRGAVTLGRIAPQETESSPESEPSDG